MNYTKKYHLPQWEEEDRILRTDFNQAMSNIETAIADAHYRFGHYYGNGKTLNINSIPNPAAVLISEVRDGCSTASETCGYFSMFSRAMADDSPVILTEKGFTVTNKHAYPSVNKIDVHYCYLIFR